MTVNEKENFTCSNELCPFETDERRIAILHEQSSIAGHRTLARVLIINNKITELNEYYNARKEYEALKAEEKR
jgi:hypothetical protein